MSGAPRTAASATPWLCGWLAGNALQLEQPALWAPSAYAWMGALALLGLALVGLAGLVRRQAMPLVSWQRAGPALGARALAPVRRPAHLFPARFLAVALATAALAFACGGLRAVHLQSLSLDPSLEGVDLLLTGRVAAMVQATGTGLRFRLEVESATRQGRPVRLPPLVELGWWGETGQTGEAQPAWPAVVPGERWRLPVRLKAPHGSRNPGGFDYELWAWQQGLQALGQVRAGRGEAAPRRLEAAGWHHPVEQARQRVRDAILLRLAPAPAGPGPDPAQTRSDTQARQRSAGVVAALVTGDQRAIARSDWDLFRTTGTAHLMSISGLHVTLFAWLARLLIARLWRCSARACLWRPATHAALAGGVLLAGLYALFSGGGIPAQRTVWMLGIVAALRLWGRRWPWPQVWLLAAVAAVLLDPGAWLQAGFWLSFVAVGVLFGSGSSGPPAASAPPTLRRRLCVLLREQVVVTMALAPLSLLLFGQVSLVGLPANLVAIPWTTLVVTPLSLLGVLAPPLWDLAALAVRTLCGLLQALAMLPHASLALPSAPASMVALAVAGGALLCMRLPWALRLPGSVPLLCVLLWSSRAPLPGQFELLAADVGQGGAVLVRTAHHVLLYDTGPPFGPDSDAGQRHLLPLLQSQGLRLDLLVLSHGDSDHIGGAPAVLAQHPQASLTGSLEPGHPLASLRPIRPCHAGQRWHWDGVAFEFLAPPVPPAASDGAGGRLPGAVPAAARNALSCVLRIVDRDGHAALLTGDISSTEEAALLATGQPLAADWMLVPHHGSAGSSSPALLAAVGPGIAVAQAGYRNRYGHPAAQTRARYAAQGVVLLDSVHCGAAGWHSGRPGDFRCERSASPRYWQHNAP